jgi:hypothetical protein
MKADRGVGNWVAADTRDSLRSDWMRNVKAVAAADIATVEEMRRHNPIYFRGANVYEELRAAFPDKPSDSRPARRFRASRCGSIWRTSGTGWLILEIHPRPPPRASTLG